MHIISNTMAITKQGGEPFIAHTTCMVIPFSWQSKVGTYIAHTCTIDNTMPMTKQGGELL